MELLIMCIKIFAARIIDVSIGTIRTISVVKGKKYISTLLAFIEVFIWFAIAKEALTNSINNIFIPIAYSAGYATGTFIGMIITERFIDGIIGVQVVTSRFTQEMVDIIRSKKFAISIVDLKEEQNKDKKEMFFIQTTKHRKNELINTIKELDPKAFIIINDTKYIQNGFVK